MNRVCRLLIFCPFVSPCLSKIMTWERKQEMGCFFQLIMPNEICLATSDLTNVIDSWFWFHSHETSSTSRVKKLLLVLHFTFIYFFLKWKPFTCLCCHIFTTLFLLEFQLQRLFYVLNCKKKKAQANTKSTLSASFAFVFRMNVASPLCSHLISQYDECCRYFTI